MMVFGIFFLIIGVVMLFKPAIELVIKLRNTMMGTQTKITDGTILLHRIIAIIWIIFSLLIILGILSP